MGGWASQVGFQSFSTAETAATVGIFASHSNPSGTTSRADSSSASTLERAVWSRPFFSDQPQVVNRLVPLADSFRTSRRRHPKR